MGIAPLGKRLLHSRARLIFCVCLYSAFFKPNHLEAVNSARDWLGGVNCALETSIVAFPESKLGFAAFETD